MNSLENKDEKRVLSFGYEDTDKKIEINLYGLIFEIKNMENIEDLKNMDKNDKNTIELKLEQILGEGAIDRINKKREEDGYCKLNLDIELNIFGCIFEAYGKAMMDGVTEKVTGTVNSISNDINNLTNLNRYNLNNREQRRNFNRINNRRYRNYRRY